MNKILATFLFLLSTTAWASSPITIIMPFPPGGGTDLVGRVLQQALEQELKRPVVVEYKTGAAGELGTIAVATSSSATPVLMIQTPAYIVNQVLRPPKHYDIMKVVPMIYLGTNVNLMVAQPNRQLESLSTWRNTKKTLNISTGSVGSINNLHANVLTQHLNSDINVITYKGSAPSLVAVLGEVTDAAFVYVSHAKPYIDDGRVVPVAVISDKRSPILPNVPTFRELGVKDMNFYSWMMVLGNQNKEIPEIQKVLLKILRYPEIMKKMEDVGLTLDPKTIEPRFLEDEKTRYSKIIERVAIPTR